MAPRPPMPPVGTDQTGLLVFAIAGLSFVLGMLCGCTPGARPEAPRARTEAVSTAPACARYVDGRMIDAPCPTPNPDVPATRAGR